MVELQTGQVGIKPSPSLRRTQKSVVTFLLKKFGHVYN